MLSTGWYPDDEDRGVVSGLGVGEGDDVGFDHFGEVRGGAAGGCEQLVQPLLTVELAASAGFDDTVGVQDQGVAGLQDQVGVDQSDGVDDAQQGAGDTDGAEPARRLGAALRTRR